MENVSCKIVKYILIVFTDEEIEKCCVNSNFPETP